MENNLVRTAELLGSKKNIVGSTSADLILETLGKIYIKSGKQTKLLNDVFKLLDQIDVNKGGSKIITTSDINNINFPGDGFLVFDTKENALYLSYDMRYLLIADKINPSKTDSIFVKKSGDVMEGQLKILHNGAPLLVASKELVKNFNAQYLNGYSSDHFTVKSLDEVISGQWSFNQDTLFSSDVNVLGNESVKQNLTVGKSQTVKQNSNIYGNQEINKNLTVGGQAEIKDKARFGDNVSINGDVILDGSIGSTQFMSGYNGYGWRFDADTNMLTVDYLVVRKAMHVFELVVNQISATNGSLWVTDSGEIDEVFDVELLEVDENNTTDLLEIPKYYIYNNQFKEYIPTHTASKLLCNYKCIKDLYLEYKEGSEYLNVYQEFYNYPLNNKQEINSNNFIDYTTNLNLINGTALCDLTDWAMQYTPSVITNQLYGYSALNFQGNATIKNINISSNGWYTLQFTAKGSESLSVKINNATLGQQCVIDGKILNTTTYTYGMTDQYVKHYVSFQIQNVTSDISIQFTSDSYSTIMMVKLEQGVTPTEYTLSQQDLRLLDETSYIYDVQYSIRNSITQDLQFSNTFNKTVGNYLTILTKYYNGINVYKSIYLYTFETEIPKYVKHKAVITNGLINVKLFEPLAQGEDYQLNTTYYAYNPVTQNYEVGVTKYINDQEIQPTHILDNGSFRLPKTRDDCWYIPYRKNSYNHSVIEVNQSNLVSASLNNISGSQSFDLYKYICKFKNKSDLSQLATEGVLAVDNLDCIQQIGLFFRNSDSTELTHVFNNDTESWEETDQLPTHLKYGEQYLTLEEFAVKNPIIENNNIYNLNSTARMFVVERPDSGSSTDTIKNVYDMYLYYKYFGNKTSLNVDNIKVIKMNEDKIPPFKEGDIVRCQKYQDGNIKYYDALIMCKLESYQYIIVTAESVFDKQTTIRYNEDGSIAEYKEELNKSQYEKTPQSKPGKNVYGESEVNSENFDENELIAGVAPGDGIVRIGHLYDRDRQNSVYITSSEADSPYIQTISGVCRPDYTVLYGEPDFITNDKGWYEFKVNNFETVDGLIKVKSLKGIDYYKPTVNEEGKTVFYAPNTYYISKNGNVVRANHTNKIKVNANVRTRLGNLNGIVDPMFENKQPYGYGLFADNVFLKGEFYLNNGQTVVQFTKDQALIESKEVALTAVKESDNIFVGTTPSLINNNLFTEIDPNSSDADVKPVFVEDDDLGNVLFLNSINSNSIDRVDAFKFSNIKLIPNQWYTLSYWVKGKSTNGVLTAPIHSKVVFDRVIIDGVEHNTSSNPYKLIKTDENNWSQHIVQFHTIDQTTLIDSTWYFRTWHYGDVNSVSLYFAKPRLVFGYNEYEESNSYTNVWFGVNSYIHKNEEYIGFQPIGNSTDEKFIYQITKSPISINNKDYLKVSLEIDETNTVGDFQMYLFYIKDNQIIVMSDYVDLTESGEYKIPITKPIINEQVGLAISPKYVNTYNLLWFRSEFSSSNDASRSYINMLGDALELGVSDGNVTSNIQLSLDGIRQQVTDADGKISQIEQTANSIALTVGKQFLFTTTSTLSTLDLWTRPLGATCGMITLEKTNKNYCYFSNGVFEKPAIVQNPKLLMDTQIPIEIKTPSVEDNPSDYENNLFTNAKGYMYLAVGDNRKPISTILTFDSYDLKLATWGNITVTDTGFIGEVNFTNEKFPGYFTITEDVNSQNVYLILHTETNKSVYFINDQVTYDAGEAIFSATEERVHLMLEGAGMFLEDKQVNIQGEKFNIYKDLNNDGSVNSNSEKLMYVDETGLNLYNIGIVLYPILTELPTVISEGTYKLQSDDNFTEDNDLDCYSGIVFSYTGNGEAFQTWIYTDENNKIETKRLDDVNDPETHRNDSFAYYELTDYKSREFLNPCENICYIVTLPMNVTNVDKKAKQVDVLYQANADNTGAIIIRKPSILQSFSASMKFHYNRDKSQLQYDGDPVFEIRLNPGQQVLFKVLINASGDLSWIIQNLPTQIYKSEYTFDHSFIYDDTTQEKLQTLTHFYQGIPKPSEFTLFNENKYQLALIYSDFEYSEDRYGQYFYVKTAGRIPTIINGEPRPSDINDTITNKQLAPIIRCNDDIVGSIYSVVSPEPGDIIYLYKTNDMSAVGKYTNKITIVESGEDTNNSNDLKLLSSTFINNFYSYLDGCNYCRIVGLRFTKIDPPKYNSLLYSEYGFYYSQEYDDN